VSVDRVVDIVVVEIELVVSLEEGVDLKLRMEGLVPLAGFGSGVGLSLQLELWLPS